MQTLPSGALPAPPGSQITDLLRAWHGGSDEALDELAGRVYRELHSIAARHLRNERRGHSLQPTGLVHEAFLRLMGQTRVRWSDRRHFYRVASQMMRRVLIDEARLRLAKKRGRAYAIVPLDENAPEISLERPCDLVALDDALRSLARTRPELAEVVELRYFTGLTLREIARLFELSPATVSRRFRLARAWLYRELRRGRDARTR